MMTAEDFAGRLTAECGVQPGEHVLAAVSGGAVSTAVPLVVSSVVVEVRGHSAVAMSDAVVSLPFADFPAQAQSRHAERQSTMADSQRVRFIRFPPTNRRFCFAFTRLYYTMHGKHCQGGCDNFKEKDADGQPLPPMPCPVCSIKPGGGHEKGIGGGDDGEDER